MRWIVNNKQFSAQPVFFAGDAGAAKEEWRAKDTVWLSRDLELERRHVAFSVLSRVYLPLAKPGPVAVSVIAFFASGNEHLFASTLIIDNDLYKASLGIATLITQLDTPLFLLMAAGMVFSVLPVLFYMAIQRHVLRGLTAGSVKG